MLCQKTPSRKKERERDERHLRYSLQQVNKQIYLDTDIPDASLKPHTDFQW